MIDGMRRSTKASFATLLAITFLLAWERSAPAQSPSPGMPVNPWLASGPRYRISYSAKVGEVSRYRVVEKITVASQETLRTFVYTARTADVQAGVILRETMLESETVTIDGKPVAARAAGEKAVARIEANGRAVGGERGVELPLCRQEMSKLEMPVGVAWSRTERVYPGAFPPVEILWQWTFDSVAPAGVAANARIKMQGRESGFNPGEKAQLKGGILWDLAGERLLKLRVKGTVQESGGRKTDYGLAVDRLP